MKKRWILVLSLFCPWALSNTLYTIQASFDVETTTTYEYQVLKLALKKTTDEYGKFQLNATPTPVPTTRYLIEANSDNIHNFIFVDSVNKEKLAELAYAKFPVLLGIIGYRVSLVSQDLKQRGYTIANKADLMNITMVQGRGWLDGDILTDNGFTLHTGKNTEGLFHMVANERAHFFPIGANQIDSALKHFSHVPGLAIDDQVVIYYPLPRYFFMNKDKKKEMARIEKGLIAAYTDGSLIKLWHKHFDAPLAKIHLKQRTLYKFKNKFIEGIDPSYEQYIYNPYLE